MPYRYDNEKGEWVYDDPTASTENPVGVVEDSLGLSPAASLRSSINQQNAAQFAEDKAEADKLPSMPFMADTIPQGASEVLKVLGNAGTALFTDYFDLAAGLGDLIGETGDAILPGGDGFTPDNIFNDADNPWTRARREMFAPETEVGKATGTLARVATALVTLPKFAIQGIALPFKLGGKAKVLGGVAERLDDVGEFITRADQFMKGVGKSDKAADTQKALGKLRDSFAKGSPGQRAAKIGAEADWMQLPLADVAKVTAGSANMTGFASWAENVQQGVRGLTQLGAGTSASQKIRTVGQALAWDAFVAFNVFGEGDEDMDATMADALYDLGLPVIPQLLTEGDDSAWARKSKQMVEGLAIGAAMNGLIDTYRAYKFADAFKKAKPTEQAQILAAYGKSSQEIGESIGRRIQLENRGVLTTDGNNVAGIRVGSVERPAGDARAETIARIQADNAAAQAAVTPPAPGGPLATMQPPTLSGLERGLQDQRIALARESERGLTTAFQQGQLNQADDLQSEIQQGMAAATLDSPVQQFLAVADGQASAINPDDALYQQRLAQQLTDSGIEAPAGTLPGPDPLAAAAPAPPRFNFDAMPPAEPTAVPGGPLAEAGRIEPVRVEDLGPARPRPPEPVVTPQTIRSAFEREAQMAWAEMERLTLTEGWDGKMSNLRLGVRRLMPSNRVDAMEYMRQFPPMMNARGVIPASDSVWSNFISQKALTEGWAQIDPDTLELYYNRKFAYELDRGDAVTEQAKALDEFEALSSYQEVPIDVTETYRAGQQEAPLEIDPTQTSRLAAAEADPAVAQQQTKAVEQGKASDAYDQWEAGEQQARAADTQQAVSAYDRWEGETAEAKAAYDAWEAQQGQRDTAMTAIQAADKVDAIDAAEELRLRQAEQMRLTGSEPEAVIVREMLGMDLGSAVNAEVVKADTTRGWNVLDRNGEQLNPQRFGTKKQATAFANAENERYKQALVSRARQMAADGEDQAVNLATGSPVLDSQLAATIKLTEAQQRAVFGLLPEVDEIMREGMLDAALTRGTAWYNVNDTNWSRAIELTQGQMNALADAIKAGLSGDVPARGPQARALRNLADKLDTQVKLLEPQARAQKAVDDLLANVRQYDEHGEFCDYI